MAGVIALIPAKGYSRRLPGKNMVNLSGLPLFLHSVKVALESKRVDKVVVSSDSDEILRRASEYGADVLKRPTALCGDDVPNFKVCQHVVKILRDRNTSIEQIALLQPTQPFRTVKGLNNAIEKFSQNSEFDSLASVTRIHRLTGKIVDDKWISNSKQLGERAQASKDVFEMTGHLFILKVKQTIMQNSLLGKSIFAWQLPESWIDIDIDTSFDFIQAETIMAGGLFSRH